MPTDFDPFRGHNEKPKAKAKVAPVQATTDVKAPAKKAVAKKTAKVPAKKAAARKAPAKKTAAKKA